MLPRHLLRCLRSLGYRVTEAVNGVDALRVWAEEDGRFDLLFTDMVMPEGLSGLELCTRLRLSSAGLRAIIASGYSAEIVDEDGTARPAVRYLSKPYDIASLAAAVRQCLEEAP